MLFTLILTRIAVLTNVLLLLLSSRTEGRDLMDLAIECKIPPFGSG